MREGGHFIGLIVSLIDVTPLVEARLSVEREKGYLEQVITIAGAAICIVNRDDVVVTINDEFTAITGFNRDQALGRRRQELLRESPQSPCPAEDCGEDAARKRQSRIVTRDGRRLTILKNTAPICDADGQATGGIESFVDVTEIIRARMEAEEASRLKSAFLANMHSKLLSARRVAQLGVCTLILAGREPEALIRALAGEEVGTFIPAGCKPISRRKFWLAYHHEPQGTLVVDDGAVEALREHGKSLLPAGIVDVAGEFSPGSMSSSIKRLTMVFCIWSRTLGLVLLRRPKRILSMFEREIDIFFYHGHYGVRRLFTYRRWMLVAVALLFCGLGAAGAVLWRYYAGYESLSRRTREVRARLAEQKALALGLRERVRRTALEMERIDAFDAKLRIMSLSSRWPFWAILLALGVALLVSGCGKYDALERNMQYISSDLLHKESAVAYERVRSAHAPCLASATSALARAGMV